MNTALREPLDIGYTTIEVIREGKWSLCTNDDAIEYKYPVCGYGLRFERKFIEGFILENVVCHGSSNSSAVYFTFQVNARESLVFPARAKLIFGTFVPHTGQLILTKKRNFYSSKNREEVTKMRRILDKFLKLGREEIKNNLSAIAKLGLVKIEY